MSDVEAVYEIEEWLWQGSHAAIVERANRDPVFVDWLRNITVWVLCHECAIPWAVHTPIDDNAMGCDQLDMVRSVAKRLSRERVLTVCSMGENRSGLASACLLNLRSGRGGPDAVAYIRDKVRPRTGQPHVLWNPGFVKQVEEMK